MNSIRRQSIQYGEKNHWSHFSWTDSDWISLLIQLILSLLRLLLSSLSCPPVSLHPDPSLSLFPFGPPLPSSFCLSLFFFPQTCWEEASPPAPCPLSPPTTHKASPCPTGGWGKIQILRLVFLFLNYRDLELLLCWKHLTAGPRTWLQIIIVIFLLLETSSSQRFSGLSAQYTLSYHPWDCFLLSAASLWGCSILILTRSWCLVSVAVNAFVRPVLYIHMHIYTPIN